MRVPLGLLPAASPGQLSHRTATAHNTSCWVRVLQSDAVVLELVADPENDLAFCSTTTVRLLTGMRDNSHLDLYS